MNHITMDGMYQDCIFCGECKYHNRYTCENEKSKYFGDTTNKMHGCTKGEYHEGICKNADRRL